MRVTTITLAAAALFAATPASARFYTNWQCGQVVVQIQEHKDWREGKLTRPIVTYSVSFEGLKTITIRGFSTAHDGSPYLNGKRCERISDEEAEKRRDAL
jgi:hypothetical protein